MGNMTNIPMPSEKSSWQGHLNRYSIKKVSLFIHFFFLLLAFFLSRAVMFEAVVPFLLPLWAIVSKRYENEKWFVFLGGLVGALSLGLGQMLILLLQLGIYELIDRFRYWKPPAAVGVALSIFFGQFLWQGIAHFGIPPLIVQ